MDHPPIFMSKTPAFDLLCRPTKEEAQELQQLVLGHLRNLHTRQTTEFRFDTLKLVVTSERTSSLGSQLFPKTNKLKEAFAYRLAQILGEHGVELGECVECHTSFLATRARHRYCGAHCRNQAGIREFRKARTVANTASDTPKKKGKARHGKKGNKHLGICRRKGRKGLWLRIALNGRDRMIRVDSVSQGDALRGRLKAE
jgi:hypothetical protein